VVMAARTVDIKLLFDPYDCKPGRAGFDRFKQNLINHGGRSDELGWSLADCLLLEDDGALNALGAPVGGGVPALPAAGGGAAVENRRAKRRKRLKESAELVVRHISHTDYLRILSAPPYRGNGPLCLAYLEQRCYTPHAQSDTQDLELEWNAISVAKDIGFSENTVYDLDTRLGGHNANMPTRPGGLPYYDDEAVTEKILRCLADCSSQMFSDATNELNAAAGVPGQPGVRLYQLPLAGGVRSRDKAGMLAAFHAKWKAAVKAGLIKKAAPTASHAPRRGTLESGFSARADGLISVERGAPRASTGGERGLAALM
jgi:hypothetical protein